MHKLRFYRNEEYEIFKYIKKCNSLLFIRCRETRIDENLTNNHFLRIGRFSISIPRMKNSVPSNFPPLLPSKIFCILFISSIYIYIYIGQGPKLQILSLLSKQYSTVRWFDAFPNFNCARQMSPPGRRMRIWPGVKLQSNLVANCVKPV